MFEFSTLNEIDLICILFDFFFLRIGLTDTSALGCFFFVKKKQIQTWIGPGVFTAPHGPHSTDMGLLWSSTRKISAPIFSRQNFRDLMYSTFVDKARITIRNLNQVRDGKQIDFQKKMFAFSMDSSMKIFCGRDTDTLTEERDECAEAIDDAHNRFVLPDLTPPNQFDFNWT
jgi:hypothetical protein